MRRFVHKSMPHERWRLRDNVVPVRIAASMTINSLVSRMTAIMVDVDQRIVINDPAQLDAI